MKSITMQMPYGAVYFRKSNPPREDWERDYAQAAADGNNIFRHWFMWGNIEVAPGVYDWEDYDKQLELAEKYGIKTIIAELSTYVPEWLIYERPDLLMRDNEGRSPGSRIGVSSATGGFCCGLCLDKEEGRKLTEGFLKALAKRYKGHPALLGYDIWNECSMPHNMCFCDGTSEKFRDWLKNKYGDIKTLGEVWKRYSFTCWEQVNPPRDLLLAPECFDWLEFKKENAYKQMKWKIDTIREVDQESLMCAHGMALSLENMANGVSDEWLAAQQVQVYGLTFVQSRKGAEDWKQFQAIDLTRSGSRGKPFWHAEAQGGHLWLQPQVTGRPRDDGRITKPEDVRLWNMISLAGGARGILYPRWRPLLDGPLFGAFAPYGMDGLPTPRSEMASSIAKWSNAPAQRDLMKAAPVKGEIGIVVVPESQTMSLLLSRFSSPDNYKYMMWGVYRSFFDNGIQADYVHIDDINEYQYLYLPYPLMLSKRTAEMIKTWVKNGGKLISEGCPAYFGDHGHASPHQPGYGLDDVFGAVEDYVEFTPDLMTEFSFEYRGMRIYGAEYLQSYRLNGGVAFCHDDSGRIIGVRNQYGKGETILLGTCPSKGYHDHHGESPAALIPVLARTLGMEPHVEQDNNQVRIRLHKLDDALFIWIINPSTVRQEVQFKLHKRFESGNPSKVYWEGGQVGFSGDKYHAVINPKDVLIFRV